MPNIVIDYEPRSWATDLHDAITRWIVLVIHRRGGKTTAALNHLQRDALSYKNTRYAYIAPTFKQAKRIVWGMAKEYAKDIPGVQFNSSELLITYPNGSEIMILGSNDPDSLRGIKLWGAFLDEYPQHSPIIFTEIITKCLADTQGYCIFAGTPKGRGHFYDIYTAARDNKDTYTLIFRTVTQSLKEETGEVIEMLRRSIEDDKLLVKQGIMTEEEFQQEWFNSFDAAMPGAVYLKQITKAQQDERIKLVPYDESLPVFTVWDLGISDAMAIGFFQRANNETRLIDYYENTGLGLAHYVKVLKNKPYVYGKHFGPHDLKKRSIETGKSLLFTAKRLGIEFEVVPSISVRDGIDLARAMWSHLWIDSKNCQIFLTLIGLYHYKKDPNKNIYHREPEHDFTSHAADVLRYAAIVEDEFVIDQEVPPPQTKHAPVDDDYMGTENIEDDTPDGMGKHPMLRGVNIGTMGHKKTEQ